MKLGQKYNIIKNTLKTKGWKGFSNLVLTWPSLSIEPVNVSSRPIFVQIEPTIDCNLRCAACINPTLKRETRMLSLSKFKEIIRQLPYVQKISLVGAGEPLLNPEIFNIIEYAKSRGLTIGFATNATLIDDKIAQRIIHSGLDWLNISLDGATKGTYENIRKGADFDAVLKNIELLIRMKGKRNKPEISVWFLALKNNLDELPGLVLLVERLGISELFVQTVHNWGDPSLKNIDSQRIDDTARIKKVFSQAIALARKKQIKFEYVNVPDKGKTRFCKWPWKSCYITVDGYVTPCCLHGADPKVINFGNIFSESFEEIWNNKAYQDFRKKLKSDDVPSICVDCPSYYAKVEI
ncbi:MAG: radical SAM protein [Candidatus Omnitrophica bacterium]|nr:radical SAM protein [Candidatus Omnitrophota bacterium]